MTARRKLKIAQLTPYFFPAIGGVEEVAQYVSEELVRRGHEVEVLTANRNHWGYPPLDRPTEEVINGVRIRRLPCYGQIGHLGFIPGIMPALKAGNFDVFHSHCYRHPQGEMAAYQGRQLRVPTLLHIHGGFYTDSTVKRAIYNTYDWFARRGILNRFDHYITLYRQQREYITDLGVDGSKISIIANAANNECFQEVGTSDFREKHKLGSKRVILYLGSLNSYKRPDILVSALPQILSKVPDAFVLFVGPDAGQAERISAIGRQLGISDNYAWIGPLRGSTKNQAIAVSEFLAMPADEDPYPLAILEALAHGKPVITTGVVGSADVLLETESGIIIGCGSHEELAKAALRLLTDSNARHEMGRNARKTAEERFSVSRIVDTIESLYYDMCNVIK